jgi:hypothetical protein
VLGSRVMSKIVNPRCSYDNVHLQFFFQKKTKLNM